MMNNSYWNPDNEDFKISCNGKIYVDKSMLIDYTNSILHTPERFICVSRPIRTPAVLFLQLMHRSAGSVA